MKKVILLVVCLGLIGLVRACGDHCHEGTLPYGVRAVYWQGPGERTCSPVDFFPHDDAGRARYDAFLAKFPQYEQNLVTYLDCSGLLHFYAACRALAQEDQSLIDESADKEGAVLSLKKNGKDPLTHSRRALKKVKHEIPYELYARLYIHTHYHMPAALADSPIPSEVYQRYLGYSRDAEAAAKVRAAAKTAAETEGEDAAALLAEARRQ